LIKEDYEVFESVLNTYLINSHEVMLSMLTSLQYLNLVDCGIAVMQILNIFYTYSPPPQIKTHLYYDCFYLSFSEICHFNKDKILQNISSETSELIKFNNSELFHMNSSLKQISEKIEQTLIYLQYMF